MGPGDERVRGDAGRALEERAARRPLFVLLLSVFVVGPLRCCVSERAARPICVGQDLEVVGGVEILSLAPRGESD